MLTYQTMLDSFKEIKEHAHINTSSKADLLEAKALIKVKDGEVHASDACGYLAGVSPQLLTLREMLKLNLEHFCLNHYIFDLSHLGVQERVTADHLGELHRRLAELPNWDECKNFSNEAEAAPFSEILAPLMRRFGDHRNDRILPLFVSSWMHHNKNWPEDPAVIFETYFKRVEEIASTHLTSAMFACTVNYYMGSSNLLSSSAPTAQELNALEVQYRQDKAAPERVIVQLCRRPFGMAANSLDFNQAVLSTEIDKFNPNRNYLVALPVSLAEAANYSGLAYNIEERGLKVDSAPSEEALLATEGLLTRTSMSIQEAFKAALHLV